MKKYEAIFILDDRKADDGGKNFITEVETAIGEFGGGAARSESMGRRQFAYPIKKKRGGIYWDVVFELPEDKVAELKNRYRLNPTLLRLEIFIYDRPKVTVLPKKNQDQDSTDRPARDELKDQPETKS